MCTMQCPACTDTTLSMSSREGIEIDYCPKCRGVWLDRGELDKIIERTAGPAAQQQPGTAPQARQYPAEPHRREHDDDDYYRKHGKYRKRGGFLGEIFDFD
jgi:Zn-finger nucleic acid-binding protein